MISLVELLDIVEADRLTVYAYVTPHLRCRMDVDRLDTAALDDLVERFGGECVRRVSPAFRGDSRVVVELVNDKFRDGGADVCGS